MPWWFEALGEHPAPIPALPPAASVLTGMTRKDQPQLEMLGCREWSALLSLQGCCGCSFGLSAEGSGSAGGGEKAARVSSGPEALKDAQDAGFLHPISASPSFRHHSSMDRAPQSKEEDVGLEILECWGGG